MKYTFDIERSEQRNTNENPTQKQKCSATQWPSTCWTVLRSSTLRFEMPTIGIRVCKLVFVWQNGQDVTGMNATSIKKTNTTIGTHVRICPPNAINCAKTCVCRAMSVAWHQHVQFNECSCTHSTPPTPVPPQQITMAMHVITPSQACVQD